MSFTYRPTKTSSFTEISKTVFYFYIGRRDRPCLSHINYKIRVTDRNNFHVRSVYRNTKKRITDCLPFLQFLKIIHSNKQGLSVLINLASMLKYDSRCPILSYIPILSPILSYTRFSPLKKNLLL